MSKKNIQPLVDIGSRLEEIIEIEKKYLDKKNNETVSEHSKSIAIAFSGGGVRAACFALGVINSLETLGIWNKVDYVSSVSGGGYAVSSVLNYQTNAGQIHSSKNVAQSIIEDISQGVVGYIGLSFSSFLTLCFTVTMSFFLVLAPLFVLVGQSYPLVIREDHSMFNGWFVGVVSFFIILLAWLTILFNRVPSLLLRSPSFLSIATRLKARRCIKNIMTRWFDYQYLLFISPIFFATQLSYLIVRNENYSLPVVICIFILWIITIVTLSVSSNHPLTIKMHNIFRYILCLLPIPSLGIFLHFFVKTMSNDELFIIMGRFYAIAIVLFVVSIVVSPNILCHSAKVYYIGLRNKFGRRRDVFMYKTNENKTGPIHLINCFSQSPGSLENPRIARRWGENFCISHLFCGMKSSGYFPTKNWYSGKEDNKKYEHQYVWRLVATSGAAVDINPIHQSPLKNIFLTLLNVGLGPWVINPSFQIKNRKWWPPFFLHFMAAFNLHNNTAKWIRLSDGGHFENLGLYELVARECMDIIVVDASYDPEYEFHDLARAVELCAEDFGAEIEFPEMFPYINRGQPQRLVWEGTIRYSKMNKVGRIKYIKLGLAEWHSYSLRMRPSIDSRFPHEPTKNQFPTNGFIMSYYNIGTETAAHAFVHDLKTW